MTARVIQINQWKSSTNERAAAPIRHERHCGVCLFDRIEIVKLDTNGICPHCGADYGKEA